MKGSGWLVFAAFMAGILAAEPVASAANASVSGATINVSITPGAATKTNNAYAPNPVQASVGDTVVWTNNDSTLHTAISGTAGGGATGLFGGTNDSPRLIAPARTQDFTFTEAGQFPYFCALHPTMVGTVIVSEGNSGLTIRTDRSIYDTGNTVRINGGVEEIQADLPVTIRVTHEDGSLVRIDQTIVSSDGRYNYAFVIQGVLFEPNKTYTLTAIYGDLTANTSFRIKSSDSGSCFDLEPTMIGTEGHDVLNGTSGNDVIVGLRGNDVINGLGGDDVICGGLGLDDLYGGEGNDKIFGGNGNDLISGNSGNDGLWGSQGWDRLLGDLGNDFLFGGVGNDSLEGGDGEDRLFGQDGDDTIDGVPEDDDPGQVFDIIVEIDDTEPGLGGEITITGIIDGADEGDEVEITIREPNGGIDDIETTIEDDGEFEASYEIPDSADEGIYEIEVEFMSEEPVFAYFLIDEEADDVEVFTDDTYEPGDDVEITGVVDDPITGVDTVEIRVLTPEGDDIGPGSVNLDGDDEFEETVNLDFIARLGIYAIIVEYDGAEAGWAIFEVEGSRSSAEMTASLADSTLNPGDEVAITGSIDEDDVDVDEVLLTVEDPDGMEILNDGVRPDPDGNFEFEFDLDADAETGTYEITLQYADYDDKTLAFTVSHFSSDGPEITAELEESSFAPGDEVLISGSIEAHDVTDVELVDINVQNSQLSVIFDNSTLPDNDGAFTFNIRLPADAPEGQYQIFLKYHDYQDKLVLFYVESPAAELDARLELDQPVNVSNDPGHSIHQDMVVSGEHVYIAWMAEEFPTSSVYFKASNDGGLSFAQAIELSKGGFNYPPILATFGSDVYVVWTHEVNGEASVGFRASHDNGATFDVLKNLGDSTSSYSPLDIAAYDNNVYIVFDRFGESETEKVIRTSHNRGVTFGEPFIFSTGPCGGTEPHVSAWENHVYLTAQDPCEPHPDLLFRVSHNNGTSFSKPLYLGDESQQVKIASNGSFVYIVWNENTQDVNFRMSSDYGETFSPTKALEGVVDISNPYPDITLSGNRDVYVTWFANTFSTDDVETHVFFIASHDNGQTFGPLKQLDSHLDYSIDAKVAAAGEHVFVVWQNESAEWHPSGSEVMLKRSEDGGASFGERVVIDGDTGDSLGFAKLSLIAKDDSVYISWSDSEAIEGPPDVLLLKGHIVPVE
jgi:plastocyanin